MAKEEMHPILKICSNCKMITAAILRNTNPINSDIPFNTIPYNCPVARGLSTICKDMMGDSDSVRFIKDNHVIIEEPRR